MDHGSWRLFCFQHLPTELYSPETRRNLIGCNTISNFKRSNLLQYTRQADCFCFTTRVLFTVSCGIFCCRPQHGAPCPLVSSITKKTDTPQNARHCTPNQTNPPIYSPTSPLNNSVTVSFLPNSRRRLLPVRGKSRNNRRTASTSSTTTAGTC